MDGMERGIKLEERGHVVLGDAPLFTNLIPLNTNSSAFVIDSKLGWGNRHSASAKRRLKKNLSK